MSLVKPLVIVNGKVRQIAPGETLDAPVSEVDVVSKVADGAVSIRDAVYITSASKVKKAQADADGTSDVLGFAVAAISDTASGSIQTDGIMGGFSSLTPNEPVFLSQATAGLIVQDVSSYTSGNIVCLGKAISATEIDISVNRPIGL